MRIGLGRGHLFSSSDKDSEEEVPNMKSGIVMVAIVSILGLHIYVAGLGPRFVH